MPFNFSETQNGLHREPIFMSRERYLQQKPVVIYLLYVGQAELPIFVEDTGNCRYSSSYLRKIAAPRELVTHLINVISVK
jgi:hypothetical protein